MPKMGESITEGTIIKWLKKVGETIDKDEIILEISTDKVDSEIPTPVAGTVVELLAKENDTVEVGKVIARIETEGAGTAAQPPAPAAEPEPVAAPAAPPVAEVKPVPPAAAPPPEPEVKAAPSSKFFSPLVLSIAREEGVAAAELENIPGTGMNGRVTKKDILNHIEQKKAGGTLAPAPGAAAPIAAPAMSGGVEVVPMDHIRKKIAEHMVLTVHTAAHVGLYIEIDMRNIDLIRSRFRNTFFRNEGVKLTYMPFIAEAVVKTLKEFPLVNASIENENILIKHFINLGIAVDTEQGLIVPVIKNSDSLNLTGLARAIHDLAERARNRKLKPDEVSGGTFSISNFGVFGTKIGFPLINQPQVAILGIGALEKRAVVVNDAIAIRPMMDISLTFDHRLIDGAMGARFLQRLKENMESYNPEMNL